MKKTTLWGSRTQNTLTMRCFNVKKEESTRQTL